MSRLTQVISVVLCGLLLAGSSIFIPKINEGREALTMYGVASPTETAPPEYAFAIQAFGAFRGLITNIAFIRAEEYKRAGRYYDAMQLASWICKLEPRFPSVWEFQSWNMAWNISVTTYTPEERWNWVYNGAKLIRDEGLKYNPRAVNLYRQLAWIFVNKMSETTDEYHLTYKRNWAYRMHLVFGRPPDPLGQYRPGESVSEFIVRPSEDLLVKAAEHERKMRMKRKMKNMTPEEREEYERSEKEREKQVNQQLKKLATGERPLDYQITTRAAYDRLVAIEKAAQSLEELYRGHPRTREMVAKLRAMGVPISDDTLDEDEYWRQGGLAHTFFKRLRQIQDPLPLVKRLRKTSSEDERDPKKAEQQRRLKQFDKIVGVSSHDPDGAALIRFLQRKVLKEVYKLDPRRLGELTLRFGPIDWRGVDAHALYWVNEGLIASDQTINKIGNDKINTARLIFFALHNLYRRNRLVFEPDYDNPSLSYINYNPDLNFIESMHEAYLTYGKILDPNPTKTGIGETFRTGHQNFLTEAVRLLYFAGRIREARHYFEYMRKNYGTSSDGRINPVFAKSLAQFVEDTLLEDLSGHWETRETVAMLLVNAFEVLARGELARYNELVKKAFAVHARYNKDKLKERIQKMQLPPFPDFQADVLRAYLQQPSTNPAITVHKARLWGFLPVYLKQAVWDDVKDTLQKECDAMEFSFAAAFPEPPNMAEYRRQHPPRHLKKKKSPVETPAQQL